MIATVRDGIARSTSCPSSQQQSLELQLAYMQVLLKWPSLVEIGVR
jgi:hypothetical protein